MKPVAAPADRHWRLPYRRWVAWLVLCFAAFDLISAPWHHHSHDVAADHAFGWTLPGEAPQARSSDGETTTTFAHSMAALPAASPDALPPVDASMLGTLLLLAALLPMVALPVRRVAPTDPPGASATRPHDRPPGRAPPTA